MKSIPYGADGGKAFRFISVNAVLLKNIFLYAHSGATKELYLQNGLIECVEAA